MRVKGIPQEIGAEEQHQGAVKSGWLVAVAFQGDFKPNGTHATSHQIGQAHVYGNGRLMPGV